MAKILLATGGRLQRHWTKADDALRHVRGVRAARAARRISASISLLRLPYRSQAVWRLIPRASPFCSQVAPWAIYWLTRSRSRVFASVDQHCSIVILDEGGDDKFVSV